MKRSKERRRGKSCDQCRFSKMKTAMPYAFKPFVFEELKVECLKGPTGEGCVKPKVPEPRSGHRIVCDDGNLYSFGGYLETSVQSSNWPPHLQHGNQRLFQELWCHNVAEGQWKQLPILGNAPKELASHSAVLHGNHLLVYGGTGVPFGGCSSNKLNICDLRTLEWRCAETTGDAPIPQYGQAVVLDRVGKILYVIGGTTGYNYSMDVHKLNMTTMEWEALFVTRGDVHEPDPRYRHEVGFYEDQIYILGGGTATSAYDLKNVATFDVKKKQWTIIETKSPRNWFPAARKCQGSVQVGEDVYISGGYDSRTIFSDLWKLHLPTMEWTEFSVRMPVPLYFHSTSVTESGCMYSFGGVTDMRMNLRTNKVFKIWLKVPKLKDMCWEALLHYNKNLRHMKHSELLGAGIPKEYVDLSHHAPPVGWSPNTSHHWASDLLQPQKSDNENKIELEDAPVAIGY